jgi:hypothetical protein
MFYGYKYLSGAKSLKTCKKKSSCTLVMENYGKNIYNE